MRVYPRVEQLAGKKPISLERVGGFEGLGMHPPNRVDNRRLGSILLSKCSSKCSPQTSRFELFL